MMATDDFNQSLLGKMTKLTNEIKGLKGRLTRLDRRLQDLELLDFQQQLDKQHDAAKLRIDALHQLTITIRRELASTQIEELVGDFIGWVVRHAELADDLKRTTPLVAAELAFTLIDELGTSDNPLAVSLQFRTRLQEYCQANKIPYFRNRHPRQA